MIGTLYRYPHPQSPNKFIYVGQGPDRDKGHRIGRTSFGRRFKNMFPGIELPQPIKEQIEISNHLDLNEEETIWIFRYHTWHGYVGGMNLTLPGPTDYKAIGLTGASAGGKATRERHIGIFSPLFDKSSPGRISGRNNSAKGFIQALGHKTGPIWGAIQGRKNAESGLLQANGRRNKNGMGILGKSGIGLCFRWNIQRDKPCTCGNHLENNLK